MPLNARLELGFPSASPIGLTLRHTVTRGVIIQKERSQACSRRSIALERLVSRRFQVLFHSPNRGTFHLSLTVLVHYRSPNVFSLGEWTPQIPAVLACTAVLRYLTEDN